MSSAETPRVIVLALNRHPGERIVDYVRDLCRLGVDVDLVVVDRKATAALATCAPARIHRLMASEERVLLRRLERLLVYRIPGGLLARARRLAMRARLRPFAAMVGGMQAIHRRLARFIHKRLFLQFYRHYRPLLLARRSKTVMKTLNPGAAERIVAADLSAITLGWRLARRHPKPIATTALDRRPYAERTGAGHET